MSFEAMVRSGKVVQPPQQAFSVEKWGSHFGRCSGPKARDRELFEAGRWIGAQLARIRHAADAWQSGTLRTERGRRYYVAFVNREHAVASRALAARALTGSATRPVASASFDLELPIGPGGTELPPVGAIETEVSALRFVLAATATGHSKRSERPGASGHDLLQELQVTMNLAAAYETVQELWLDVLWDGTRVERVEEGRVLVTPEDGTSRDFAIAQHRWYSFISQAELLANASWHRELSEEGRRAFWKLRPPIDVDSRGRLSVRSVPSDLTWPPPGHGLSLLAEELYWNELLIEPLPKLAGLTVRDVLAGWDFVSSLGWSLFETLPSTDRPTDARTLLDFAPAIAEPSLRRELQRHTGLGSTEVDRLVALFSVVPGDAKTDPWFTPIVPVGSGKACLVVPAATVTNGVRLIEYWLRKGGAEISARGGAFERYARREVSRAIDVGPCRGRAWVLPDALEIGAGDGAEEIDLVFGIDDVVVVAELKCSLFPVSGLDRHKYRSVLEDGCEQASRKAARLEASPEVLADALKRLGRAKAGARVVPVVVSNLPLGVGSWSTVPVVDLHIVTRFFECGYLDLDVVMSRDREPRAGRRVAFYTSAADAAVALPSYLASPPQVAVFADRVRYETRVLPVPAVGIIEMGHWTLDVDASNAVRTLP